MKHKPRAPALFFCLIAFLTLLHSAVSAQTVNFTNKNVATGISPKSVAIGDFNRDGIPDLAVVAFFDKKVVILIGQPGGTFVPPTPANKFDSGPNPIAIVTADFDGDGRLDLAVANHKTGNVIRVFLGNGDGTFGAPASFSAGVGPHALAVGDFNRDGIPDLAVVNDTSEDVSILLGVGDGTFSGPTNFSVGPNGSLPISVAVGDLDGDGILDLVVTNNFGSSVAILLGAGDGTFTLKAQPNTNLILPQPTAAAIGDFNGDGIPDLAIANSGGRVTIRPGVGDGTFTKPVAQNFTVGTSPQFVVAADFNGDGILDLATANLGNGKVSLLTGVGDGTFALAKSFSAQSGARFIAVGDLDGDGKPDLAVANDNAASVSVLLNATGFAAAGAFAAPGNFGAHTGPSAVAAGDFDHDGALDLAVANEGFNDVSILLGAGNGTFGPPNHIGVGSSPVSVAIGDFNRDGFLDVVTANNGSDNVSILLGDGLGSFSAASPATVGVGAAPSSVAVGDFNRDGKPDLAVANQTDGNVTILLGNGDGTFTEEPTGSPFAAGAAPSSVAVGDFNRDGKLDLAVTNQTDGNVTILLGNGDGTFTEEPTGSPFTTGAAPFSVAVGDFNRDGKVDLAVANNGDDNVSVLLGAGDGTFAAAVTTNVGDAPSSVVVGDFNRDGNPDLAVANSGDDNVTILFGDGAGSFSGTLAAIFGSPFAVGSDPRSLAVGDFDGDGRPDLAAANHGDDNVSILLNTAPPDIVLSPQTGDVWHRFSTQTIRWVFTGGGDFVNILISKNGGAFTSIIKKTPNDGIQTFNVTTSTAGLTTAQIKVCRSVKPITCTPLSGTFSIVTP